MKMRNGVKILQTVSMRFTTFGTIWEIALSVWVRIGSREAVARGLSMGNKVLFFFKNIEVS